MILQNNRLKGTRKIPHLPLLALISSCAVCTGLAQSNSDNSDSGDEDVFELSPFTVTGEDDTGYRANSTLTGGRLRTSLNDVGAAISVMTKEFLEDTNSTDLRDALVYGTGTEVTGVGGNFSGAEGGTGEVITDGTLSNNTGTRVRGLASATKTRNYFRSEIPFDTYNSSRLEINRGSNALLFGVGSPAGIINYGTKQAQAHRRFGDLSLQVDRFGSARMSWDINQPIIEDEFAVRLSLLSDEQKFQQDPAFSKDKRTYLAAVYSPKSLKSESGILAGASLRVSFENGEIESNVPRSLPPNDNIVRWFEPTDEMLEVGITAKGTRDNSQPLAFGNGIFPALGLRRSPSVIFPTVDSSVPSDPIQTGAIGRQMTINSSSVTGSTTAMFTPGNYADSIRRMGAENSNFYKNPTLADRSVFDFRNNLIDGENKRNVDEFQSLNLSLEQLFFDDKAGVELVYDNQAVERHGYSIFPDNVALEIDVNTHLVGGEVNPNFGRPWVSNQTKSSASWYDSEIETLRATAFVEWDAEESIGSDWGRWLGRHTLSAIYQDEESYVERRSGDPIYISDYPWEYGTNSSRFSQEGKGTAIIQYIGPSMANLDTASGANLSRVQNNLLNLPEIVNGQNFYLREQTSGSDFDLVSPTYVRARLDLEDNASSASKDKRIIESQGINLQSRFLSNNVITNIGIRREEVQSYDVTTTTVSNGEGYRLVNDPSYVFDADPDVTVSADLVPWNVMAKVPTNWMESVPVFNSLAAFYNKSENFSPPSGLRISPFGEALLPPTGENKEYGIAFELAEGRASGRITWFETTQGLVSNGTMTGVANYVVTMHRLAFESVREGIANDSDGDGFPDFYVAPPQELLDLYNVSVNNSSMSITNPGVAATGDFVSKGLEMEFVFNPTANWTIAVNAAKQESVRQNTGADVERLLYDTPLSGGESLVDTWLELWTVPLFETGTVDPGPDTSGTLRNYTQRYLINPFNSTRLQDGAPAQELRKWRFNAVTNYKFTGGVFDGFNVGGAYRWEDKVAVGFPLTLDGAGDTIIDVNNPFYGPANDSVDFWLGYQLMLANDKVRWKLQLNLKNAFPGDDLIPVFAQPDGEVAVHRISASRVWSLRSTFSF